MKTSLDSVLRGSFLALAFLACAPPRAAGEAKKPKASGFQLPLHQPFQETIMVVRFLHAAQDWTWFFSAGRPA
jgi:hypothetical protein